MLRYLYLLLVCLAPSSVLAADKPNVLFIAVDDLRPELGCYGQQDIQSPNIDRLAARGTTFLRAYCQQAVCNPSRASIMTGLRPDTTRVWDLPTHFRDTTPDAVTIAQHFKAHGYHSEGIGKIFHTGHGNRDDKFSWSRQVNYPKKPRFSPEGLRLLAKRKQEAQQAGKSKQEISLIRGVPWEAPDLPDGELTDGAVADQALKLLNELKDRPFFLAVGFLNPHLPFVAPKKYWDLYQRDAIQLPDNMQPPEGMPSLAGTSWGELRRYHGIPARGPLSRDQAISMIHGYWAAVSYVDAQVGRLLNELDRLGLADNTIVVLWGDHGWKLGEHGMWCKHTNFELDAHAPLIISAPGQQAAGKQTPALVEFVDVFPTLCELAELPLPDKLEGTSAVPLLNEPQRPWKAAAFSQYPRGKVMGYTMKTDRYRFTQWVNREQPTEVVAVELYDHQVDPAENHNLAAGPEHAALVAELAKQLAAGWQASKPRSR